MNPPNRRLSTGLSPGRPQRRRRPFYGRAPLRWYQYWALWAVLVAGAAGVLTSLCDR